MRNDGVVANDHGVRGSWSVSTGLLNKKCGLLLKDRLSLCRVDRNATALPALALVVLTCVLKVQSQVVHCNLSRPNDSALSMLRAIHLFGTVSGVACLRPQGLSLCCIQLVRHHLIIVAHYVAAHRI